MLNQVLLIGRVGRDPELRYTATTGKAVTNFPLATDYTVRDKETNAIKRETEWHRIVVMGDRAQWVATNVTKGRLIFVEGRIRTRKYTDRNGIERRVTEILANRIMFVEPKPVEISTEQAYEVQPTVETPPLSDISSIPTLPEDEEEPEE
ncbi:MAG: single-stranded DNA-binding protein [bacterium JZ-2024 1]